MCSGERVFRIWLDEVGPLAPRADLDIFSEIHVDSTQEIERNRNKGEITPEEVDLSLEVGPKSFDI